MTNVLKGTGWRSSRRSEESSSLSQQLQQQQKEASNRWRPPIPKHILGKPSPRYALPHTLDDRGNVINRKIQHGGIRSGTKIENHTDRIKNNVLDTDDDEKDRKTGNFTNRKIQHGGIRSGTKIESHADGSKNHVLDTEDNEKDRKTDNVTNRKIQHEDDEKDRKTLEIEIKKDEKEEEGGEENEADRKDVKDKTSEKEGEEEQEDGSNNNNNINNNNNVNTISKIEKGNVKERNNQLPKELSSSQGAGYRCRKVVKRSEKSFPRVPNYSNYSNLLPESYKMPWKQDMKNRSAILANVHTAGTEKLPNIEHNDFLFLRHREQFSPNVEKKEAVEKKQSMPSIKEILNPAFHHHTIKDKAAQTKAIFPANPAWQFHHPRLRHVTGCYACQPDYDE